MAQRDPERSLLEVDDRSLSYAEIDAAVDRLAARLHAEHPEHPMVAVRCEGTHEMVVATMAVERAGAVLVTIEPSAPADRVIAVLDQVDPVVLLTDVSGDEMLPVPVAHPLEYVADPPRGGVKVAMGPLAAVMFTSGSSGVPKGVMCDEQRWIDRAASLPRMVERCSVPFGRSASIAVGTAGFAGVWIAGTIAAGGTVLAYELRHQGLAGFGSWLVQSRASNVMLVPTVMRAVLPTLPEDLVFADLRTVVLGGEASTWENVRALRPHLPAGAFVVNGLTQSEVGISSFVASVDDIPDDVHGPLPAGEVLPSRSVCILGPDGSPVADGESGEIVVDTAVGSLGYWREPKLSAAVFTDLGDGRRRVRTGDGGRILPSGVLEHLGRIDNVVKVSGNRVDLGDVEVGLRSLEGVADAAVTSVMSPAEEVRLAAYVVAKPGIGLHPAVLRARLGRRLPSPMLPDHIQVLDELPRLPGGKLDRQRLPERTDTGPQFAPPANDLERQIVRLMSAVLNLDSMGIHDDFFELGGDSLAAVELFVNLERELGIDRPVTLIVEAPTPSALAAAIATDSAPWQVLVPLALGGALPPLFIVHDGGGDIFYARRLLPGLGSSQPVHGLRPRGLTGLAPEEDSIQAVAADYLTAVQAVQPRGPYLLYGFSLGGVIAFEMACQLQARGEVVALLGLGDIRPPRSRTPVARAGRRLAEIRELPAGEAARLAAGLTGRLAARITRRCVAPVLRPPDWRRRRQLKADTRAHRAVAVEHRSEFVLDLYGSFVDFYQPTTVYAGPTLLIRGRRADDDARDLGWSAWIDGTIDIVDVDAAHLELHDPRHCVEVAQAIRQAIDNSLAALEPRILATLDVGVMSS